jgi:hypothetical protein
MEGQSGPPPEETMMSSKPAGQVITCVQVGCAISTIKNPATMLISRPREPGRPTCDSCARSAFDHDVTGQLSLHPLSEYVDMFAEAKQALNATPGQVIRGETATGRPTRQHWDTGEAIITPVPAPAARVGNGFTAEERAARGGRDPAARRNPAATRWAAGAASLTSLALGITLCSESVHMEQSFMTIWGIFFIALPFLVAGIALVIWILKLAAVEAQRYKAWKATLSPEDRRAVDLAELAALTAGAYAVHERVKHSRERSAALYQERSAASRAGSVRHSEQMAAAQESWERQYGANQQGPAGPGPTRRSDIHGNLI